MHTICPAYDGSVSTSWYPVMAVLKTTSPSPTTSAPRAAPTKARPSSRTSAAWDLSDGNDHRLVDAVLLGDKDLDALRVRCGHVLADVIRSYRQLAMATVDEHRQLDRSRAPEVHERVHGSPRGAAVVDDVIHQHDHLAVDVGHIRLSAVRRHTQMKVVAMLADVQRADGNRRALELHKAVGEPAGEVVALGHDTHHDQVAGAAVPLQDLVGDPRQRSPDLLSVHHRRLEPSLLYCAHDNNLSSRAIRMNSPLRAWRKYAARGSASTSGAISTTLGSGCITIASFLMRASVEPSMR